MGSSSSHGNADLIEGFIRNPDVEKHHEIVIQAPASIVFDVAEHFDLHSIPTITRLFRLREFLLRIRPKPRPKLKALASETAHLGGRYGCLTRAGMPSGHGSRGAALGW